MWTNSYHWLGSTWLLSCTNWHLVHHNCYARSHNLFEVWTENYSVVSSTQKYSRANRCWRRLIFIPSFSFQTWRSRTYKRQLSQRWIFEKYHLTNSATRISQWEPRSCLAAILNLLLVAFASSITTAKDVGHRHHSLNQSWLDIPKLGHGLDLIESL